MEILLILLGGFIGYFIGYSSVIWKLRQFIKDAALAQGIKVNKDFTVTEEHPDKTEVRKLEVEQVDDVLYLYDRETKDFVCQASTIDELAKACRDYKNILLATVIHDNKVFMFVNGNSKEYTE
jgi:hypothetical protein